MKTIITILLVSIVGTVLIKLSEYFFGIVEVFLFCVVITGFVGIIYVPYKQLTKRYENNN